MKPQADKIRGSRGGAAPLLPAEGYFTEIVAHRYSKARHRTIFAAGVHDYRIRRRAQTFCTAELADVFAEAPGGPLAGGEGRNVFALSSEDRLGGGSRPWTHGHSTLASSPSSRGARVAPRDEDGEEDGGWEPPRDDGEDGSVLSCRGRSGAPAAEPPSAEPLLSGEPHSSVCSPACVGEKKRWLEVQALRASVHASESMARCSRRLSESLSDGAPPPQNWSASETARRAAEVPGDTSFPPEVGERAGEAGGRENVLGTARRGSDGAASENWSASGPASRRAAEHSPGGPHAQASFSPGAVGEQAGEQQEGVVLHRRPVRENVLGFGGGGPTASAESRASSSCLARPPPHFAEPVARESHILSAAMFAQLHAHLPTTVRLSRKKLRLCFAPRRDGISLRSLLRAFESGEGFAESLVVVREAASPHSPEIYGRVFGGFATHPWELGRGTFYGGCGCFVFRFEEDGGAEKQLQVFHHIEGPQFFQFCDTEHLAFGGSVSAQQQRRAGARSEADLGTDGGTIRTSIPEDPPPTAEEDLLSQEQRPAAFDFSGSALVLQQDLLRGCSLRSDTFGNSEPLSTYRDFVISDLEVWVFVV